MRGFITKFVKLLGSRPFFYGVLALFAFESLWIALSAVYPMAFDEDFHLGIIKIYSHHWLPFLQNQPENASQFGALAADPSYLYHYLMSFPYRFFSIFTSNQTILVILLRLINIALAVWGVALFRKVLRRAGTSPALTNTALALFVLIPIVPLLAGQINYDNLILPLTAWICLLVSDIYDGLRQRAIKLKPIVILAVACLLGSLVKFSFLPIALAAAVFVALVVLRQFWGSRAKFVQALCRGYHDVSTRAKVILLILLVLSGGLFIQRYGVNLVRYHTPIPDCGSVLSEDECIDYGPWARNNRLKNLKNEAAVNKSPLAFTWQWLQSMHYRLFFAINGPADDYRNFPPLPLPAGAVIIIGVSGLFALALNWRAVFRGRKLLIFLFGMSLLYCCVLWFENYSDYLEIGQPVAINGRYLLPVLLPLAAVFGRAFSIMLRRMPIAKALLAGFILLLFLHGGGLLSFILRSDEAWYWPNHTVIEVNNTARRVLAPIIFEGGKYY
ncbi:MAG TPA: hypothetical protein VMR45_03020 [Patescibacteria group bacterium]|nr:hypothetical protein [Patescibacteria group bacterium]